MRKTMRERCEFLRFAFSDNARNACAAGLSLIDVRCAQIRLTRFENNSAREKRARADSESQVLATKKFLCLTPPERPPGASKAALEPNRAPPIRKERRVTAGRHRAGVKQFRAGRVAPDCLCGRSRGLRRRLSR